MIEIIFQRGINIILFLFLLSDSLLYLSFWFPQNAAKTANKTALNSKGLLIFNKETNYGLPKLP